MFSCEFCEIFRNTFFIGQQVISYRIIHLVHKQKFSEKLAFITPWYGNVCVRIKLMISFQKYKHFQSVFWSLEFH